MQSRPTTVYLSYPSFNVRLLTCALDTPGTVFIVVNVHGPIHLSTLLLRWVHIRKNRVIDVRVLREFQRSWRWENLSQSV